MFHVIFKVLEMYASNMNLQASIYIRFIKQISKLNNIKRQICWQVEVFFNKKEQNLILFIYLLHVIFIVFSIYGICSICIINEQK